MDYTLKNYYNEFENIETKALLASNQANSYKVNIHIVKELNDIIVQLDRLSTKFLSGEFGNDKIINTFTKKIVHIKKNLNNILLSLQSDYTNAENIYIELNNSLVKLKGTNKNLEAIWTSRPSEPSKNDVEYEIKYKQYKKKFLDWQYNIIQLKQYCESLRNQINGYISYLQSIDGVESKKGASGKLAPDSLYVDLLLK